MFENNGFFRKRFFKGFLTPTSPSSRNQGHKVASSAFLYYRSGASAKPGNEANYYQVSLSAVASFPGLSPYLLWKGLNVPLIPLHSLIGAVELLTVHIVPSVDCLYHILP